MSFVEAEKGVNINDLTEEEYQKYLEENKPVLKCDHRSHEGKTFVTNNTEQMQEHQNDGKHTITFSSDCAICGRPNIFVEHGKVGKKPICDKCKEELIKE